jgi:hypothetical protein
MEGVWNRKKLTMDCFPRMRSNSELYGFRMVCSDITGSFENHCLFRLYFLASFPLFLTLLRVNFTSEPLTTKQKPFNTLPFTAAWEMVRWKESEVYGDKQYTRHFFTLFFLLVLQYFISQFSYRLSPTRTTAGHNSVCVLWTEMTSGIWWEKLHRFCSGRTNSPNSVFRRFLNQTLNRCHKLIWNLVHRVLHNGEHQSLHNSPSSSKLPFVNPYHARNKNIEVNYLDKCLKIIKLLISICYNFNS